MKTLAATIRGIRKGRTIIVKANANVAKMTAYRQFGAGGFSIEALSTSPVRTRVRRVK
jgi:hypothetical protein